MATLSVAVMAHPKRAEMTWDLARRLDIDNDRIVWDRNRDVWDTGRRAMLAYRPDCDWHLVVQDDILICRDLVAGLEKLLDHVPQRSLVGLYIGTIRPMRARVSKTVQQAREQGASWIITDNLISGPAFAVPTSSIDTMISHCDRDRRWPHYDKRVGQYYWKKLRWPVWHPWPSLVDHRQGPSLLTHLDNNHVIGRRAHEFIGENASALSFDPSGDRIVMGKR